MAGTPQQVNLAKPITAGPSTITNKTLREQYKNCMQQVIGRISGRAQLHFRQTVLKVRGLYAGL